MLHTSHHTNYVIGTGAKVEITFKNGEKLIDEMALANAHSDDELGAGS